MQMPDHLRLNVALSTNEIAMTDSEVQLAMDIDTPSKTAADPVATDDGPTS